MAHIRPHRMSPAEFLEWEALQDTKWEFDGLRPIAMVGGTEAHATIQGNLISALTQRLRGAPCRPYGSDFMVPTGQGRYRYPDAHVTCTRPPASSRQSQEPVVVFEILSESTARTDRTTKLLEYRSLPSLRRYVLLEQDQAYATVISRAEHGWSIDVLRADDTLHLPEIEIAIPMTELYADVELPPPPPDSDV